MADNNSGTRKIDPTSLAHLILHNAGPRSETCLSEPLIHDRSMSFSFRWPRFSDQFHADAMQMLNTALNKGNKPPVIADRIEVVELEMGTQV
jgi:hypothetical protein